MSGKDCWDCPLSQGDQWFRIGTGAFLVVVSGAGEGGGGGSAGGGEVGIGGGGEVGVGEVGGGPCFPAGTPVRMANGSKKPIENVKAGDRVVSADPETGKQSGQKVVRMFVHLSDTLLTIRTEDGRSIEATPNHPFWVEGKGFVAAKRLARSDLLVDVEGRESAVASVVVRRGEFTVYNFEVESTHTYYAGEAGSWVHNDCSDIAVGHFDGAGGAGDIYRYEPPDWPGASPGGNWNWHDVFIGDDGMVYDPGRGHEPMPFDDWTQTVDGWNPDWFRNWGIDEWNAWWEREILRSRYGP